MLISTILIVNFLVKFYRCKKIEKNIEMYYSFDKRFFYF